MYSKLQYISQGINKTEQIRNIQSALDAGCDWIQLRFKQADEKLFFETAEEIKKIIDRYQATYIINDNVHVTKKVDADGVHLGLKDLGIAEARTFLGNEKIIGGTANTLADVLQRVEEKCSYVGLGPFRFTTTKDQLSPILGLEGYKKILHALAEKNIIIPVYAIGGIELTDVGSIMNSGVHGIAVSGIITKERNKKSLIEQLNTQLHATT